MEEPFDDPLAVAQASFLLLRNLLKYLYISGKFDDGELSGLLLGTIGAAEASNAHEAARLLKGLTANMDAGRL